MHRLLGIPIEYGYRGFSITLPAEHRLPSYRERYPKYDAFLPKLAGLLRSEDTIVDVGANVGDTLAGMAESNSRANYICIEADGSFFRLLERNVGRMRLAMPGLRVHPVQALVGKSVASASLEGKGGTRHAVVAEGGVRSRPLDQILAEVANSGVRLLKSDVDGFDYDILDSSMSVIERHGPLLFFEVSFDHAYQRDGYAATLDALHAAGYHDWTVFDNFGQPIVRTTDLGLVRQLIDYLAEQNAGLSTRTIYYYDILAAQAKDAAIVDQALAIRP